jgi:hypothetical protein
MAEERDGDHLSAEAQIAQARESLVAPRNVVTQLAFEGMDL